MAKEIAEEYTSSLADLTLNSKPLINMLTMLADDNIEHAAAIVQAVETHLDKVRSEFKLPVLYLIDSIVKNVGRAYTSLFTQNIVNSFCSVFEKVDEKVRAQMFKLRQTWSDVFPVKKLYTLDIRVQSIDPAWPIIAPPPTTHNIHVNPKFFNKPSNASPAITVIPPPVIATGKVAVPLDPQTLDMQTQLINKQKELLELKQKKLELELLQAKAKLEEQQKQLEKQTEQTQLQRNVAPVQIKTTAQQQLLLKPEVAKQLLTGNKTEDSTAVVKNHSVVSSVKSSSGNNVASSNSGGPRIGPVSSALLANVRPVLRDPRLQRQQQASATVPSKNSITPSINHFDNSNSVNLNVDNKEKVVKSQYLNKTPNFDSGALQQQNNNKLSSNKINHNKDPRLINFKLQGSINVKKSNQNRPATERSPKSKQTSSNKSKSSSPSSQSSRSIKQTTSPVNKTTKETVKSSDSGSKSPQSPSKYKKKPLTTSSPSKLSDKRKTLSSSTTTKSESKKSRDKYIENDILTTTATTTTTKLASSLFQQQQVLPSQPKTTTDQDQKFKGLKSSSKNRNYMRRNRTISISPEPPSATKDVDLRVPPEKIPRLTATTKEDEAKSTTIDENPSNKDVDLRTLVVPAPISKKRSSTEKLDGSSNAKKSKSQMFDVLFGNEDVDLRQLPSVLPTATVQPIVKSPSPVTSVSTVSIASTVNRPPTPPPPIISTPPTTTKERETTPTRTKETAAKEIKSNLDAIRAKLANATKSTFNEDSRKTEDTDMRLSTTTDALQKIIISQADEQLIRNGNLSQALVEKVLTLFETQKLQEAQRRESETDGPNVTLQPISDDELSVDFSHSESEEESSKIKRKTDLFGDTDERIPPPAPVISQQNEEKDGGAAADQQRLQKRGQDAWHSGHHRRRRIKSHWEPQHPLQQNVQSQQHQQIHPQGGGGPQEQWARMPHVMNQGGMYRRAPFPIAPYMRPPGEGFGPMMDVPILPPLMMQSTRTTSSPPIIGTQTTKELPLADPLVLEYINQDSMRTINIDGAPREIRYYEETAIAMLAWDDPREISFQTGTRKITFDDKETYTLAFNDEYKNLSIGGNMHRIRLGAPTRELYIDNKFYECYFGGQGIGIELDGKMHVVKMEGPPPCVRVGSAKRIDLVAGKINLIINARQLVPVFLDAKPQKFDIEGKIHTLRFVDALRTVLINEIPFKVEFGGLPKPITVHNKKHFIRFSVLPKGIKPGYITIANMEGSRCPSPNKSDNNDGMMKEVKNDTMPPIELQSIINPTEPALPMYRKRLLRHDRPESPEDARISPTPQGLDVLSSIMTSPMVNNASSNITGYQVEKGEIAMDTNSQDSFSNINNKPNDNVSSVNNEVPTVSGLPAHLNINDLFQKLVASGIVTSTKEPTPPPVVQRHVEEPVIRPVLFTHPETLKVKQQPLVQALYSGMQCSSCGVRFPSEHTKQYSQHLDWHFRQNRRGKNSARKALCRKWYYDVSDWKNYEEIEDIEEREKNWFESQQQQQAEGGAEEGDEEIEIPSVPADSNSQDACCEVCHDRFEQFYNEEKEEWHLRMAIRVDEKTYHPLCYDDYKASLIDTSLDDPNTQTESKDDIKQDDDDIELKSEEIKDESDVKIEEIKDEEPEIKMDEDKVDEETLPEKMDVIEDDDDDVVIQEPNIVQIEIDDKMDVDVRTTDSDDVIFQSGIFIKQEPIDDDVDINLSDIKTEVIDPETETVQPMIAADTTHAELVSSIDGNVQMSSSSGNPTQGSILGGGKIKINITKPIPASKEITPAVSNQQSTAGGEAEISTIVPAITSDEVANEPLPPGEELVQLNLKPALQGLTLLKQPPVTRGTELTGLCSIM